MPVYGMSMRFAVASLLCWLQMGIAQAWEGGWFYSDNNNPWKLRGPSESGNESDTHHPMTSPTEAPSDEHISFPELLDPSCQPKFMETAPQALLNSIQAADFEDGVIQIGAYQVRHQAGLRDPVTRELLETTVLAYGPSRKAASWPGPTILAQANKLTYVNWENHLFNVTQHPFVSRYGKPVIDTSIHWAYGMTGYENYSIENDGIPLVPHLHGMNTDPSFDGYPEAFYSPGYVVKGPWWRDPVFVYENAQPAATLWYHDHALGITRLNVNAGLAGFYILRDELDTGVANNALSLPVGEFERAYVIQDRMFNQDGSLFFPAFKGDPYYQDFILDEGAAWDSDQDGATLLAEFFGDFITVNGKIWPKDDMQPRLYRLRLLNGCDSRFLVVEFWACPLQSTEVSSDCTLVPYTVIGTDQGLLSSPMGGVTRSMLELGARLDLILDFGGYPNQRVIMKNLGGDSPFGGDIPGEHLFEFTDRIMAFDVAAPCSSLAPQQVPDETTVSWPVSNGDVLGPVVKVRSVGLFEGKDEFGRLQPMLGGEMGINSIETMGWSDPITENPTLGTTEEWIIFNFSEDAHPVHLHKAYFQVVGRYPIIFDSHANDDGFLAHEDHDHTEPPEGESEPKPSPSYQWFKAGILPRAAIRPKGDGVYLENYVLMEHNATMGQGIRAVFPGNPANFYDANASVVLGQEYYAEIGGRKDVVTAMPMEATIIRMRFNRLGQFVWHCHILSHEDHEMMRPFEVVEA